HRAKRARSPARRACGGPGSDGRARADSGRRPASAADQGSPLGGRGGVGRAGGAPGRCGWYTLGPHGMIGIGQTLGNYHVVAKLGSGGMGAVYMAEHPLIGKRVALKVIHRDLAMNREVVTRFFNEARAVNQIGNDHIVDINDFGQTPEGEYFLIMELLDGKSLRDTLQRD